MEILSEKVFEGRNIYSHKKVIRLDLELGEYSKILSKDIDGFNKRLISIFPELKVQGDVGNYERGFYIRLIEGTYLTHICEHILITLQNRLGINVSCVETRKVDIKKSYVVFEYEYKRVAISLAQVAIGIISDLINNIEININKKLRTSKEILKIELKGPSTKAIYNSAKAEGLPIIEIGNGIYQLGYGKRGRVFSDTIGSNTSAIADCICKDKCITKKILEMNSIPVVKCECVADNIKLLEIAHYKGYPVVLKPQFGSNGTGVVVNIKSDVELLKAYELISENTKDIIIEEFIEGRDYRVCVINYNVVAVSQRIPPYVIGDGSKTIKELIDDLNKDILRGVNCEKPLTKIKLSKELDIYLKKNKHDINEIIKNDTKVVLRENANLATGGFAEDVTDLISEENIRICERAAKALGLDMCGIDICTNNISKSLELYGGIIEVNAAPEIRMHECPTKGIARNVSREILKSMYKTGFDNIPIISVTGSDGDVIIARLIAYVISLMGYTVGLRTIEEVSIGASIISKRSAEYESIKSVLINKEVEFAVLESTKEEIIKNGLGYDLANVGVVASSLDGYIKGDYNTNELTGVESLVIESITEGGYAVINADDYYCEKMIKIARINNIKTILFSLDKENKYVLDNKRIGNPTVYLDDEFIAVHNRSKEYKICDYRYMPIMLEDECNKYNALAACSALIGINMDYAIISKGFLEFENCVKDDI